MPRSMFSICALLLVATAPVANAQLYLRLVGETQGPIDGDVVFGPLTGTIATSSFSLSVFTPMDPVTGIPTGQINVSPLTLSKGTDSATIGILTGLRDGELLTTCTVDAYRANGVGGSDLYLRLTLTGARLESWNISSDQDGNGTESMTIAFDTLEWHDYLTGDVYNYTMGSTSVRDVLDQNLTLVTAPNPSQGPTDFAFRLPQTGTVSIKVYDLRGRHVATVFDGKVGAEQGIVSWDGRDTFGQAVASGVYLVKMHVGGWLTTQKMSVVR